MSCECGKHSCSCETPQMVYLADENGVPHPFYIADRVQVQDQLYAFLVSTEHSEQYALLKVMKDDNGNEWLTNIEDEAEWERIEQALFAG
jgi:uncharacterized protein YrzB (UPF0473 family)